MKLSELEINSKYSYITPHIEAIVYFSNTTIKTNFPHNSVTCYEFFIHRLRFCHENVNGDLIGFSLSETNINECIYPIEELKYIDFEDL